MLVSLDDDEDDVLCALASQKPLPTSWATRTTHVEIYVDSVAIICVSLEVKTKQKLKAVIDSTTISKIKNDNLVDFSSETR